MISVLTPISSQRSEVYTYDPTGNRLTSSLNGASAGAYTLNTSGLNQYATAASLGTVTYDTRGNTTTVGSSLTNCVYDANKRLVSAVNPTLPAGQCRMDFAYDPLGRCVARTTGSNQAGNSYSTGILNYHSSWNLIEDRSGAGATQRVYVQGRQVDEIAAVGVYSGGVPAWYAYHYDALGNVKHLTGASGAVQERYSYDSFGIPYLVDGATGNATAIRGPSSNFVGRRFAFQGHEYIPQHGLYDFRNRIYHPQIGRFMQSDPIRFRGRDTNVYRFCHNNPLTCSDASGLLETDSNGNLMFDPLDTIRVGDRTYTSGVLWTNDGHPIPSLRMDPNSVDVRFASNCHGYSFANENYVIDNREVHRILTDDGWRGLGSGETPSIGDIAVWRDSDGNIIHSAMFVSYAGDGETMMFLSKPGSTPEMYGDLATVSNPPVASDPDYTYGSNIKFYSRSSPSDGSSGGYQQPDGSVIVFGNANPDPFGGLTSFGGGDWRDLIPGSETVFPFGGGGQIPPRKRPPQ